MYWFPKTLTFAPNNVRKYELHDVFHARQEWLIPKLLFTVIFHTDPE